jgi:hypothetical protein
MLFTRYLLAALPALVMATEGDAATTTCTSTTTLTKTLTLSEVHTVTSTFGSNTTTSYMPTNIGTTSYFTSPTPSTTGSGSGDDAEPTQPPAPGSDNAGAALDAGKMAWAGLAGIIIMAVM